MLQDLNFSQCCRAVYKQVSSISQSEHWLFPPKVAAAHQEIPHHSAVLCVSLQLTITSTNTTSNSEVKDTCSCTFQHKPQPVWTSVSWVNFNKTFTHTNADIEMEKFFARKGGQRQRTADTAPFITYFVLLS